MQRHWLTRQGDGTHRITSRVADGKEMVIAGTDVALAGSNRERSLAKVVVEDGGYVSKSIVTASAADYTAGPLIERWERVRLSFGERNIPNSCRFGTQGEESQGGNTG